MNALIIINLKCYVPAQQVLPFIQRIRDVRGQLALAPSLPQLTLLAQKKYRLVAQHADPVAHGPFTGSISVAELAELGIWGTLLNHAEKKITFPQLKKTLLLCQKYKIKTIACAASLAEVKKITPLKPDYLAYEPPELIGSNHSVTSRPEALRQAVALVKGKTKLLCGAGIHEAADLQTALRLGTHGILLSHAVVQAKDPRKFLEKMLRGSVHHLLGTLPDWKIDSQKIKDQLRKEWAQ